jgi:hypothetical protein
MCSEPSLHKLSQATAMLRSIPRQLVRTRAHRRPLKLNYGFVPQRHNLPTPEGRLQLFFAKANCATKAIASQACPKYPTMHRVGLRTLQKAGSSWRYMSPLAPWLNHCLSQNRIFQTFIVQFFNFHFLFGPNHNLSPRN